VSQNKNYTGKTGPPDVPDDAEFVRCNFSQPAPIDVGGLKRGVRLFPGDDTPRAFTECNMVNAEPPPGSTLTMCNTTIRESGVVTSIEEVTIDGETIEIIHHSDFVYGRIRKDTLAYEDKPTPEEIEVD